jgi:hypothetical protein
MSTAQRVSPGFHRLALLLAIIPLLAGGVLTLAFVQDANKDFAEYQKLSCAQERISREQSGENPYNQFGSVNLKQIGCSSSDDDMVTVGVVRSSPQRFDWLERSMMLPLMGLTLALTWAVYGLVRAIGWVIGGFAAS